MVLGSSNATVILRKDNYIGQLQFQEQPVEPQKECGKELTMVDDKSFS